MPRKSAYKTKQMDEVRQYMEAREGKHVTVAEICQYFKENNISVGMTTIYRRLDKLVEQGMVTKYVVDGTSSACFEYNGHHETHDDHDCSCYHCKCEKCGKIIHLECDEVKDLGEHMLAHHGFQMNYHKTVFYGICQDCREAE